MPITATTLTGAMINPLSVPGRKGKLESNVPSVGTSLTEVQESRKKLVNELKAKGDPLRPEKRDLDVKTAKDAISRLTPEGKQVLQALLLNVAREATLKHRLDHSPDDKDGVTSSIDKLIETGDKQKKGEIQSTQQSVSVGSLDRVDQARVLQSVLGARPQNQFFIRWGDAGVNQAKPKHLSNVFITGSKDPTYTGLFGELRSLRGSLNLAIKEAKGIKSEKALKELKPELAIRTRDLLAVLSAPSESAIGDRFDKLLSERGLTPSKFENEKKLLKSVGFLMYTLEPARDPLAQITNLLAERLVQKGVVTARHFIYPTGKLGTLTPANISNDTSSPKLEHRKGKVPELNRRNKAHDVLDEGRVDKTGSNLLIGGKVPEVKADRTYAVIEALLTAAIDSNKPPDNVLQDRFRQFTSYDKSFQALETSIKQLAQSLGDKGNIDKACDDLRQTFIDQVLETHYAPTPSEKALKALKPLKVGDRLPDETVIVVKEQIKVAIDSSQFSQVLRISEGLQALKQTDALKEIAGALSAQPVFSAQVYGMAGDQSSMRKIAEVLEKGENWVDAAKVHLMLNDTKRVTELGVHLLEQGDVKSAGWVGSELVRVGAKDEAVELAETLCKHDASLLAGAELFSQLGDAKAVKKVGEALLAKGMYEEVSQCGQLLVNAKQPDEAAELAQGLIDKGKFMLAADLAEQLCVYKHTVHAEALASALNKVGEPKLAADIYLMTRNPAEAAKIACDQAGLDPDLAYEIAVDIREKRQPDKRDPYDQALNSIADALAKTRPLDAAKIYLSCGNYDQAIVLAKSLIDTDSDTVKDIACATLENRNTKENQKRAMQLGLALIDKGEIDLAVQVAAALAENESQPEVRAAVLYLGCSKFDEVKNLVDGGHSRSIPSFFRDQDFKTQFQDLSPSRDKRLEHAAKIFGLTCSGKDLDALVGEHDGAKRSGGGSDDSVKKTRHEKE